LQEFLNWTVDTIREDRLISPWLEEKKFEWTPVVARNITNILDKNFLDELQIKIESGF
jgi:hypothetical protein